jgi:hypothetical protein
VPSPREPGPAAAQPNPKCERFWTLPANVILRAVGYNLRLALRLAEELFYVANQPLLGADDGADESTSAQAGT